MSLTQFDVASAGRIAQVVRLVEGIVPSAKPLDYDPVLESGSGRQKLLRMATFTGAWATATAKVVTFKNQTTTPNTVSAINLTMHLPDIGLAPPFDCQIAKEGTAWYLVSAIEHNVKRGTFAAPWNKNTTKTVSLVNGGSVTALNRHANITGSGTRNCTVGRDNMDWELIAAEC